MPAPRERQQRDNRDRRDARVPMVALERAAGDVGDERGEETGAQQRVPDPGGNAAQALDHAAPSRGRRALTRQPPPSTGAVESSPPYTVTRSRIPSSPRPEAPPSSRISTATSPGP